MWDCKNCEHTNLNSCQICRICNSEKPQEVESSEDNAEQRKLGSRFKKREWRMPNILSLLKKISPKQKIATGLSVTFLVVAWAVYSFMIGSGLWVNVYILFDQSELLEQYVNKSINHAEQRNFVLKENGVFEKSISALLQHYNERADEAATEELTTIILEGNKQWYIPDAICNRLLASAVESLMKSNDNAFISSEILKSENMQLIAVVNEALIKNGSLLSEYIYKNLGLGSITEYLKQNSSKKSTLAISLIKEYPLKTNPDFAFLESIYFESNFEAQRNIAERFISAGHGFDNVVPLCERYIKTKGSLEKALLLLSSEQNTYKYFVNAVYKAYTNNKFPDAEALCKLYIDSGFWNKEAMQKIKSSIHQTYETHSNLSSQLYTAQENVKKLEEDSSIDIGDSDYVKIRGYIVQQKGYNVYEVILYDGRGNSTNDRGVLKTTITAYSSKGNFSLYAYFEGYTTVTLNDDYGGFTQSWPIYVEANEIDVEIYNNLLKARDSALAELDEAKQRVSVLQERLGNCCIDTGVLIRSLM